MAKKGFLVHKNGTAFRGKHGASVSPNHTATRKYFLTIAAAKRYMKSKGAKTYDYETASGAYKKNIRL